MKLLKAIKEFLHTALLWITYPGRLAEAVNRAFEEHDAEIAEAEGGDRNG